MHEETFRRNSRPNVPQSDHRAYGTAERALRRAPPLNLDRRAFGSASAESE